MIDLERFVKDGYSTFNFADYSKTKILLPELEQYLAHVDQKIVRRSYIESELDLTAAPKVAFEIAQLEEELKEKFLMSRNIHFNFVRIRRYKKGTVGTRPHTEKIKTVYPVFILVLENGGHFGIYNTLNKYTEPSITIPATIGTAIMLNTNTRYCVRDIKQERFVIILQVISQP